jgi:hypothetical protein
VENGLGLKAEYQKRFRNATKGLNSRARIYLSTETGLLSVITTLTLCEKGSFASLSSTRYNFDSEENDERKKIKVRS